MRSTTAEILTSKGPKGGGRKVRAQDEAKKAREMEGMEAREETMALSLHGGQRGGWRVGAHRRGDTPTFHMAPGFQILRGAQGALTRGLCVIHAFSQDQDGDYEQNQHSKAVRKHLQPNHRTFMNLQHVVRKVLHSVAGLSARIACSFCCARVSSSMTVNTWAST